MLAGRLDASGKDKALPSAVQRALDFLRETDFRALPDGRYDIDGDRCYAKLAHYTTKQAEECYPEAHRPGIFYFLRDWSPKLLFR